MEYPKDQAYQPSKSGGILIRKNQVAKKMKMESKTYTHSRCGKCNRFGHHHDKCSK